MCHPYEWGFGWGFGPKFSKQEPFFGRFSINMGGLSKIGKKNSQKWVVFRQNSS